MADPNPFDETQPTAPAQVNPFDQPVAQVAQPQAQANPFDRPQQTQETQPRSLLERMYAGTPQGIIQNAPDEQKTALAGGLVKGFTGANPDEQTAAAMQKDPFLSGTGQFLGNAAAYTPAMMASPLGGWAGVSALHEIVNQATDLSKENTDLSPVQRGEKVATAGYSGLLGSMLFANVGLIGKTITSMAPSSGLLGNNAIGETINSAGEAAGKYLQDVSSNLMNNLPANVQLYKNIIQRAGAAAASLGSVNAVDNVAQDIESGKAPDVKNALVNFGVGAAMGGIMQAAFEAPALNKNVIATAQEISGQNMTLPEAQKFLSTGQVIIKTPENTKLSTISVAPNGKGGFVAMYGDPAESTIPARHRLISVTAPIDPATLNPALGAAVNDVKQASAMNWARGGRAQDLMGITDNIATQILSEKGILPWTKQTRLTRLDEIIYRKISAATGQSSVPEWRSDYDYTYVGGPAPKPEDIPGNMPNAQKNIPVRNIFSKGNPYTPFKDPDWANEFYSKMNPRTADQIKNLISFRNQIAAGAKPADAILNLEVARNLNYKQVVQLYLDKNKQIMGDIYAKQDQASPLTEKPVSELAPGEVHTAASEPVKPEAVNYLQGADRMEHLARVQGVLDIVQDHENKRADKLTSKGIPTNPVQIPMAENLDKVLLEKMLNASKDEITHDGNENTVQERLLKMIHRENDGLLNEDDRTHTISAETMNPNKEQATETPIFDWRTLQHITIGRLAQRIKDENVFRLQVGEPLIDPDKDLIVHKHVISGQEEGIEKKVRSAILLAYGRSHVDSSVKEAYSTSMAQGEDEESRYKILDALKQRAGFSNMGGYWTSSEPNPFDVKNYGEPLSNQTPTASEVAQKVIEQMKNPAHDIMLSPTLSPTLSPSQPNASIDKVKDEARIESEDKARVSEVVTLIVTGENVDTAVADIFANAAKKGEPENENDILGSKDEPATVMTDEEGRVREALIEFDTWAESRRRPHSYVVFTNKETGDLRQKDLSGVNMDKHIPGMPLTENEERLKLERDRSDAATWFNKHPDQVTPENMKEYYKNKRRQYFKNKKSAEQLKSFGDKVTEPDNQRIEDAVSIDKLNEFIDQMPAGELKNILVKSMEHINQAKGKQIVLKSGHIVYENVIEPELIHMAKEAIMDGLRNIAGESQEEKAEREPSDPGEHGSEITWGVLEPDDTPVDEDGEDLMHTANPIRMAAAAFSELNPNKIRVKQYGKEPRECAMPVVLSFMRRFPLVANLDDWFTMKVGGEKAMEIRALQMKMRFSSGEALDYIQHFAMYEGAVDGVIRSELQPLHDDIRVQIKQFFRNHPLGIKLQGKQATEAMFTKYQALMKAASEMVGVRSYDCHSYFISEKGFGPHVNSFEKEAYVNEMKMWYDFFKKQYNQADIIRWNTQRTSDLWDLLKDPLVMNNDRLQRIILFYKAQVETPLLMEQIRNGIFSNADIWKSIVQGYTLKNFGRKNEQEELLKKVKSFFVGKQPLGAIKMPQASYSSQQAFNKAAETEEWRSSNDFLTDNATYMKRALLSIKQAQLLNQISKLPLPKLEFFSPKWVDALRDHPIPKDWKLFKVQASTDQVIQQIADHMTKIFFSPSEIQKGLDIYKQTGKNPYAVSPMAVLTEGGWIQSHQDDGLNKWYRGSFSPPFVYKTLYDMIQTIYRTSMDFDRLPGWVQLYMTGKQMLLIDPLVHVPQYIGNSIMNMPMYAVPGAMVTLPIKSTIALFKGLTVTGPKILAGTYTKDIGMTPEERQWSRIFTEHGATMVGGYNVFLHNMIGLNDKGLFPQRQEFGDRFRDYLLSGFGTTPSVLGEMIGQQALRLMIKMAEEYVKQGMDPETAVRTTVYRTNTSMNNLNHVSWAGSSFGSFLAIATYSKNFAVGATRMMMMASQTPVGGAIMGGMLGSFAGPVGMVIGGVAGSHILKAKPKFSGAGAGAARNVLLGTDIPEQYRDQLNSDMLKGVASVLFWTTVFYGVTQLALYQMQKEEDKVPGEEFWWNNPVPMVGSVKLFMKNVDNQPIFAVYNSFRLGKDIADQLAPLINQSGKALTGNKDFNVGGKGPVKYTVDKFGAALSYIEAGVNRKFLTTGEKVWDTDEREQWKQAAEGISYIAGKNVPINPWMGANANHAKMSNDPFINFLLESATLYGIQYKTGTPEGGSVSERESEQWRKDVGHEDYLTKNGPNPFANFGGGRNLNSLEDIEAARERGEISQRQFINFFKKQNPYQYFKQNKKAILTAESEDENNSSSQSNPFDEIEHPEDH